MGRIQDKPGLVMAAYLVLYAANVAQPAINAGAAAEDVTVWAVLSFGAAYLLWLPSHRPSRATATRTAAPA